MMLLSVLVQQTRNNLLLDRELNLYQITSASNVTISSKRLYKNNFENTMYKNCNSQISRCKYYMSSKIWDIN